MYFNHSIGKRSLTISSHARKAWNDIKLFKESYQWHFVWWEVSVIYKWDYSCQECKDTYEINEASCQACCPHFEFDHYICLDCNYEKCPGDDIDAAEYLFGDR